MAARPRRRGDNGLDAWPGYVDALSTLLMVIIFVLLVFILAQGFLATTLSGRNHALDEARQELTALRQALNQEQARGTAAEANAKRLGNELAAATTARASLSEQLAALRDMTGRLTQERDRAAQQLADITLAYDAARIGTTRLESGLAEARTQARDAAAAAAAAQAARETAEQQATAAREKLPALEKDAAGLRERLAAAEADAATLRERVATAETAAGTLREQLAATEANAAATRDKLAATETDLASMRTRLAAAAKDNAGLRERQDEIETAGAATRSRLAEAEKELVTARDRLAIAERAAINARNDAAAAADRAAAADKATTAARSELTAANERLAASDKAAVVLRADVSAATTRATAAEKDIAAARERLAAIEKDLATAQRQLADAQKQRDEMQRQAAALDRTVTADKAVIEAKLSELAEMTRQARGLTTLRDELQKQVRELTARLADQTEARGKAEAATDEQRKRADAGDVNAIILRQEIATLRAELGSIAKALEITRQEGASKDTKIADLGRELNAALAQKVEQLQRYRSEFFGRLRTVLESRSGIQVVGDRFVLQGEILFPPGSAELTEGGTGQMTTLALTVRQIAAEIPDDIPWVLRVDGHTDPTPVRGGQFASNWELSAARAITVVKWLIAAGVPPERLVAAGFGEYQPLVAGATPDAYAKDRRIELRLTDR